MDETKDKKELFNSREISELEEEIRKTKYNKHTQYHIGTLKAKLAMLKETQEKHRGIGSGGKQYAVKKTGDATVLLVGFPSVGKSTLLNRITNASSKIGDYDFTTLDVIPGMMEYNSANIQILDVPGLVEGASSGRGRGREILSVIRNADMIVIMIDKPGQLEVTASELYNAGLRLNQKKPDVMIKKTVSGGLKIGSTVKLTKMDQRMIKDILGAYKIHNAEVLVRDNVSVDEFIDALSTNRIYIPSIIVYNKADLLPPDDLDRVKKSGWLPISAKDGGNIELLKRQIWERLRFMRIYMKRIGKDPDMKEPMIMKRGSTVQEVAQKIRNTWVVEYAKIWGPSARFEGQQVSPEKPLQDRDIVELHLK
jgi:small GTP-binding protein